MIVVITHPEKVLFPEDGITKGDLAAYYEMVAPLMLPHIREPPGDDGALSRPASARRASGRRTSRRAFPRGCERVEVPKKDGIVHHPLVTDLQSLLWIANQNTITPHVWISRAPDLMHPDVGVFDLDPSKDEPEMLRAAAVAAARSARRARAALLDQDLRARRASTSSRRSTARPTWARPRDSRMASAGCSSSRYPKQLTLEFHKTRSRRPHPHRHRPQRLQRDVRRRLRRARRSPARRYRRRARGTKSSRGEVAPGSLTLRNMARADQEGRRRLGRHAEAQAIAAAADRAAAEAAQILKGTTL